ncbi:hypothetical protein ACFE04_026690 [Oxalis oulophora]
MNLITTVIGFGMSATFIVFVCTRIICGRIRAVGSRPMLDIETRIDLEQPEHRIRGLEPVMVAAIPTLKFNREAFDSLEDAQCSICLGEYQELEVLRIMPKCGHNFHLACIDTWLRKQSTCPVCRFPLQELIEGKHSRQASLNVTPASTESISGPDISVEYSRQMLLYNAERLVVNESNQGQRENVYRNSEIVQN